MLNNPDPEEDINVRELLMKAFEKHQRAYLKFKSFLPKRTAQALEEDWNKYYLSEKTFSPESADQDETNVFADYLATNLSHESNARELAIMRIEKLLSHAK